MKTPPFSHFHLGHALSGAASLFREIATPDLHPDPTWDRDRCSTDRVAREAQSRALGKYLTTTLAGYSELDRDVEATTAGRGSLAMLGAPLLKHGHVSKARSQQSVSSVLDLLAMVFETTNQQYKLAQGIATVIVPLLGRKTEGVVEVKQFVPIKLPGRTAGRWVACPSTRSSPQIHQVLKFVDDPEQPVQIRMKWRGMQTVQVHQRGTTDVLWGTTPWIDDESGPLGTVFLSPVLWPRIGRITTNMGIVVDAGSSTELTTNYDIVIDLQHNHDTGDPVDHLPPEDIVIPVPDPTPDSHPLDILSRFDPDQLRRLRDLTYEFIDARARALDALVAEIGVAAVRDSAIVQAALIHVNPPAASRRA